MKNTHLVASELLLVLLIAGCANHPVDEACRAGLEKDSKVLSNNGHQMQFHRSPYLPLLLSAAERHELAGDYQSCLSILNMARINRHMYHTSGNYYPTQNTSSWDGQYQSDMGSGIDAAHHAAGHTHHHGHN
jgi:hypothetical protein